MKNIPLSIEKLYKTILIEKVELLIQRMRWKAHLYENSELNTSNPLNYIFKNSKCAPQHKDLMQFENDLLKLIKSVKFKKVKNKFLDELQKDISSIKKSKNVVIFADKTQNIYETDKNTCSKLLTSNISKTYKKHRSIKKLKLFQITMEFQKELIVLQNLMHSFL